MLRHAWWTTVLLATLATNAPRAQPRDGSGSDQGSDQGVITAQQLFATPRAFTDGTNVRIENAVVRAKTGILLRVAAAKHEIFVAVPDPSALDFVAVGAHVAIQGTLRRTPSAPQARLVYAMSSREAHRLARTRFYVDAWSVTPAE